MLKSFKSVSCHLEENILRNFANRQTSREKWKQLSLSVLKPYATSAVVVLYVSGSPPQVSGMAWQMTELPRLSRMFANSVTQRQTVLSLRLRCPTPPLLSLPFISNVQTVLKCLKENDVGTLPKAEKTPQNRCYIGTDNCITRALIPQIEADPA